MVTPTTPATSAGNGLLYMLATVNIFLLVSPFIMGLVVGLQVWLPYIYPNVICSFRLMHNVIFLVNVYILPFLYCRCCQSRFVAACRRFSREPSLLTPTTAPPLPLPMVPPFPRMWKLDRFRAQFRSLLTANFNLYYKCICIFFLGQIVHLTVTANFNFHI